MSQAYVPAAAQRARLAKALSLQYYSVCEALPKGEKQNFAAAGNRTRVARVAGEHHTTRPQLLLDVCIVKSPVLILSG